MKEKQTYEAVIVLHPKAENKQTVLDKVAAMFTGAGAKVNSSDNFGMKELVYKIKGQTKGDFWVFEVESPKAIKLNEISLFLNREPNVIRYLILKK